jgi:uncharacterized protein YidB (DUF937 family)
MVLLNGLVGGAVGPDLVSVVSALIEKHGGLPGIIDHLQQHGLGTAVRSWIRPGQNLPMSIDQVHEVFGSSTLIELAVRLGLSPQTLARQVAELLPLAIDYLTPAGSMPAVPH